MLRLTRRTKRTPEKVKLLAEALRDKIIKYSCGEVEHEEAENMAYRCIAKMDFNNKYQMHRSLDSYAEGLLDARKRKLAGVK